MANNNKAARRLIIGTAIAAAAGYVAGVLTAPKSGKETRKDIQNKAIKIRRQAESQLKKTHSELSQLITKGKQRSKNLNATAKARFVKALAAAQAAKDKARDMLSAIHEGDADDAELKKAVKDVNKAVDRIKTFLEKNEKPTKTNAK